MNSAGKVVENDLDQITHWNRSAATRDAIHLTIHDNFVRGIPEWLTSSTRATCRSYAEKDSRIRYHRNEENLGAAWNFNQVFHLARGKYFQWACHDDVWTSTLLERYVQVLDQMSDEVLCYSITAFIDEHGKSLRRVITRPFFQDKRPHQRFRSFLKYHIHPDECNPVLGLFRASILEKSPLIGSYPADVLT